MAAQGKDQVVHEIGVWVVIDVYVINAFIFEKSSQTTPKRTQKQFRLSLHVARKSSDRSHSHPLPTLLRDSHFPELLELRRRCHVCMKKNKMKNEHYIIAQNVTWASIRTLYYCPECNLGFYTNTILLPRM